VFELVKRAVYPPRSLATPSEIKIGLVRVYAYHKRHGLRLQHPESRHGYVRMENEKSDI
jgi:hypothetical protein